jgi:hypothetical protein
MTRHDRKQKKGVLQGINTFKLKIIIDRRSPRQKLNNSLISYTHLFFRYYLVNNPSSEAGVTWGPMGTQPRTRPVAGSADWGRLPAAHWQTRTLADTRKKLPSHIWVLTDGKVLISTGRSQTRQCFSMECCKFWDWSALVVGKARGQCLTSFFTPSY